MTRFAQELMSVLQSHPQHALAARREAMCQLGVERSTKSPCVKGSELPCLCGNNPPTLAGNFGSDVGSSPGARPSPLQCGGCIAALGRIHVWHSTNPKEALRAKRERRARHEARLQLAYCQLLGGNANRAGAILEGLLASRASLPRSLRRPRLEGWDGSGVCVGWSEGVGSSERMPDPKVAVSLRNEAVLPGGLSLLSSPPNTSEARLCEGVPGARAG